MSDSPHSPGGSIEATLQGRAELEIGAVLREAWHLTDGIKAPVTAGLLAVNLAVLVAVQVLGLIFGVDEPTMAGEVVAQLVLMIIVYPFMAGVFMFGLRRSVGRPVRFQDQFAYYGQALPIVAVGALQSLMTFAGLLLFLLPGIYLMFALSLAVPLRAERQLPIGDCLLMSMRLVNRKFFEVAVLSLAAAGLTLLGILSLIGWIWTIPWTLMILAITYRQLAGHVPPGDAPAAPGRLEV